MKRICSKCGLESDIDPAPMVPCPRCGAIYDKVDAIKSGRMIIGPRAPRRMPKRSNHLTGDHWFGILLVLLVIATIVNWATKDEYEPEPTYTKGSAIVACEGFVRDRLKAPASADFSSAPVVNGHDDGPWVVRSYVDAQNSFGAMLRMHFTCTVHFDGQMQYLDGLTMQ